MNISGFGAVTGAVGGAFGAVAGNGSLTFGLLRGARKGLTGGKAMGVSAGFGSAKSGALRDAQRIAAGGSMIVFPGAQAKADRLDAEKEEIEAQSAAAKVISDNVSTVKEYALSQINDGKFVSANTAKRETAMLRISSLQEQASKIKNSDYKTKAIASLKRSDYASTKDYLDAVRAKQVSLADADRARITSQLEVARKDKNDAEKAALDDFVKTKRGSNAVLDSALGNITDAMEHDTTGIGTRLVAKNADGIKGGTGDWLQLDALDGNAKDIQNKNTIRIAENTRDGKRARANAKYSGNGK